MEGLQKPKISCKQKSCFSIRNSSSIHIENLVFTDCFSEDSDGGAIFVSKAEAVNITQCIFINNFIRKRGGAMRLELIEKVHILDSQFVNNSAICHPSDIIISFLGLTFCSMSCTASSGAVSAFNITDFLIEVSHFESNTASCFNGAVLLSDSNTDLINNSFVRNSVTASLGQGGGLLVFSGITRLSDCTFEENHAGAGGGISSQSSQMDIINCSFSSNTAGRSSEEGIFGGGAGYFSDTILSIDECSFTKNMAGIGGAIGIQLANSDKNVIVSKSKFQSNLNSNLSMGTGGAIFLQLSGEPSCTVSCISDSEIIPTYTMPVVSIVGCSFVLNGGGTSAGAIHARNGVLNVTGSEFKENSAQLGGVALGMDSNFGYFHGNDFRGNQAIIGGAVDLYNGIVYSSNNTYSNNTGENDGGAIRTTFSTLFSYDDHYSKNYALTNGGAISAEFSDTFGNGCMFLNNSVVTTGGAAVFQVDNSIQLYNTTFCDNKAFETDQAYTIHLANVRGSCSNLMFTGNIGSMYLFYSTLNFSGVVSFTDNNGIAGGALTLVQSTVSFEELTEVNITSNSATYGGGVFLSQSEFRVYTPHLIIHNNTATDSGGGIYAYQSQISINVNETFKSVLLSANLAVKEGGAVNAITSYLNIFMGLYSSSGTKP